MSNRNGRDNWQDRVHQVVLSEKDREIAQAAIAHDEQEVLDNIVGICVDNGKLSIKSVEYYDCFAFTYTFEKHHPIWAGHSFWFYHADIAEGIAVMRWYVDDVLPDLDVKSMQQQGMSLW